MDYRQPNRRFVSQSNARTVRPAEKMPPVQTGKSRMEKGFLTVKAGTMKTPGFTT